MDAKRCSSGVMLALVVYALGAVAARADGCAGRPDNAQCSAADSDSNECTYDLCRGGACAHPPVGAGVGPCGPPPPLADCKKNVCNGAGACVSTNQPDRSPCSDEPNDCTYDGCNGGVCEHRPKPDETPCAEENPANSCTKDQCRAGVCAHDCLPDGTQCADEPNVCTKDGCLNCACTHQCREGKDCKVANTPGECSLFGQACSCIKTGQCCDTPTGCEDTTQQDCQTLGGHYKGDGTSCGAQNVAIGANRTTMFWDPSQVPGAVYDVTYARIDASPGHHFHGDFSSFAPPSGSCAASCGIVSTTYEIGCKGRPPAGHLDMWLVRPRNACVGTWNEGYEQVGDRDVPPMGVPASTCPSGVCVGGRFPGGSCAGPQDCPGGCTGARAGANCASNGDCPGACSNDPLVSCTSSARCRFCNNDHSIPCTTNAQCAVVGGSCGSPGACSGIGGCTNPPPGTCTSAFAGISCGAEAPSAASSSGL